MPGRYRRTGRYRHLLLDASTRPTVAVVRLGGGVRPVRKIYTSQVCVNLSHT